MMQLSHSLSCLTGWFPATDRQGIKVAQVASSIVILVGCAVLVGWTLDVDILKSAIAGLATTMKVNTAICFVLAGISLWLQTRTLQTAPGVRIANVCAIAIFIIALVTICQYLFWWNFGIDELLFRDVSTAVTDYPGRMGVNTAVNFFLVGTALWLMNRSQRRASSQPYYQVKIDKITIAQIMTTVAGAIAIQALIGYAYRVQTFSPVSSTTTSMAVHTALGFVVVSGGILALRSDRGFMRALTIDLLGGNTARRLIPAAILLPPLVGWTIWQGQQQHLYDSNFALSLMAMSMMTISLGLIRQNAGILNRLDYARIRSADRIRASKEQLQLALQGAKEGIWDWDLQTQVLTWNDRCKEIFGYSPDLVVNFETYLNAIHADDRQQVTDVIDPAVRTCGEFDLEYRIVRSDGTIRWVLTQGCCYPDPLGEPCRMLGTMLDITPRKQVQLNERFLHELTRRLGQLAEPEEIQWEAVQSLGEYLNVDRVMWSEIDWEHRLATADRNWCRDEDMDSLTGVYALSELMSPQLQVAMFAGESVVIGDVNADPLTTPYLDRYRQLDVAALANIPCINQGHWVAILHVNTKTVRNWRDDEVALLQAVTDRLCSSIDRVRAVRALRQEIAERKRMESERLEAERERARFFNLSIDLLAIGNFDSSFLRLNPAWERVLGFTEAELIAQPFINFVHPDDRAMTEDAIRRGFEEHWVATNFENRYRCKDGTYRWLAWSTMPYPEQNLMYGIARDVTESKLAAADLERRNRELDNFVHVVAHDLKAPLRAITNLAQWIEEDFEGSLSPTNQQQMALLRTRVRGMEATIHGLLDYARVGRTAESSLQRTGSTNEPIAVSELLAETIELLVPPPTFSIEIAPNLPTLHANRLLLSQVFTNLIGNAIKHHNRSDGKIRITVTERDDVYEFEIADDGSGIDRIYHEQIFNIFHTVNPQNRADSSGVGLAIVKRIVEAQGGTIRLESEPGQGATFYFTWPK
jgi:PAS domain S-box-containing protein